MQLLEIQRGAAWNIMYYQVVVEEIQGDTRSHTHHPLVLSLCTACPQVPCPIAVLRRGRTQGKCERGGDANRAWRERDCEDERE